MWAKYSSRRNVKAPRANDSYPCSLLLMVVSPSGGLADVGPALDAQVALAGLQDDDTRPRGAQAVGGVLRQQRLVAALQLHPAHLRTLRRALDEDGAVLVLVGYGLVDAQLDEMHLDLAVHDQRELVVRARVPGRLALGAQRLQHVDLVLPEDDLLVGLAHAGDLEAVRERVVLDVVRNGLHAALLVVLQRSELRVIRNLGH